MAEAVGGTRFPKAAALQPLTAGHSGRGGKHWPAEQAAKDAVPTATICFSWASPFLFILPLPSLEYRAHDHGEECKGVAEAAPWLMAARGPTPSLESAPLYLFPFPKGVRPHCMSNITWSCKVSAWHPGLCRQYQISPAVEPGLRG